MIPHPSSQGLHRLPDGRTLGWAEYGDPGGVPLLFFHGTPGCRYTAALLGDAAARAGVRVLGVDRPGQGVSDPQPGRTLRDWPADVASLADGLGLHRFGAAGWSGGGVHALVCGLLIPERLASCTVIAGVAPPGSPAMSENLTPFRKLVQLTALHAPVANRALFGLARLIGSRQEGPSAKEAALDPVGNRPDVWAAGHNDFREALKQGVAGASHDFVLNMRPWGFEPEDVRTRVDLWMGAQDTHVSPRAVQHLISRLPECQARIVEGRHYLPVSHGDDIVRVIKERAEAAA